MCSITVFLDASVISCNVKLPQGAIIFINGWHWPITRTIYLSSLIRLLTSDHYLPTTNYRLPTTYQLQTTDYRLPTTDYQVWLYIYILAYFSKSSSSSFKCTFTILLTLISISIFRRTISVMLCHPFNLFNVFFFSFIYCYYCYCIIILKEIGRCLHVSYH